MIDQKQPANRDLFIYTTLQNIPSTSISADPHMAIPAPQAANDSLIDAFKEFLRERHGEQAVQVFDQRLDGGDVKELVGNGLTSYAVKQLVQKIKSAAREFAANDPEFLGMIEKAFRDEAKTVARRFAGKQN